MELILSGYGKPPQKTLALYRFEKDKSIRLEWQDTIENASFVCQGEGYLFTITEVNESSIIYSYRRVDNQYQLYDQRQLEGGSLCHITYSSKNKALFGACYGTGTVFSIRVKDGKFEEVLFHENQLGSDSSILTRAHCVLLNKEESELIVANIALDCIYFYKVSDGALSLSQVIKVPKGVGPRHALLSRDEKVLYVITEYSNEILIYDNNQEKQLLQRISTLSQDYSGSSFCSTLCFSKSGAYLYAANRGADTITLFAVQGNGELLRVEEFICGGKSPRHMIVSEDGSNLIVCNQNSDDVVIFDLDIENGFILEEAKAIMFTAPSGILEVK